MNAPRALVSSCVIEADVLDSQTAFYDVKTEVLYLRGKSLLYWREAGVLHFRGKSYNTELVL